jgi:hypothetical protein
MTSHMKKKKAKRYQEGGEAEDKKRGLAASNKEGSVGFFERLRMGNIDDPKSEAYKRFGAGRGKAEAAKTTAPTINQVDERLEEGKTASGMPREARGIENKPKKKSTFGAAFAGARADGKKTFEYPKGSGKMFTTQTKEEAAAAKSTAKPAVSKPAAAAPPRSYRGTQDEGDAGEEAARKAQEAKMAKAREMRKQTDPGDVPANVRRTQEASAKSKPRDMTGFAQRPFSEQMEYLRTKGREGTGFKAKEGLTKKKDEMGDYTPFKKGGTVSSASKRADGIAMRGKTRGRMV